MPPAPNDVNETCVVSVGNSSPKSCSPRNETGLTGDLPLSEPAAERDRSQDVAAQGGVVGAMTVLSRLSGFARDVALSHLLGAGAAADVFFVAFRAPNFFRRLFAEGAFAQGFVPVLAEYRERGSRSALRAFVAAMGGNLALAVAAVSALGVVAAPLVVFLFAPGFAGDARFDLATDMVRITFPYLAFISLTAFAGSLLNSAGRYAVPAFTPVLLNATLIAAALVAAPAFEEPAMALAWGVLAAGAAQFLFQLPWLRRAELMVPPKPNWKHPGARQVGKLLVPAALAASAGQVNILIGGILASMLATGSVSWLYYADRLMELPIGIVAVALGTVLLPNLSRLHTDGNAEGFRAALDWGMRAGVLLGLPAAVGLYVLATPIVATVFLHGEMRETDALMASAALKAFAIGLLPLVLTKIAAPGYFARQDTVTPLRCFAASVAVNIVGSLSLIGWLGHVGIALATSLAAVVHAWLLIRGLARKGDCRLGRRLLRILIASLMAAAFMALALEVQVADASHWLAAPVWERAAQLALAVVGGGALYLVVALALGVRPGDLKLRV